ncbi:MAG: hypothetical protein GY847_23615 [Proteobacteria bacterium]|nr:hypothetical protein [Pseudomonadota bacterium]
MAIIIPDDPDFYFFPMAVVDGFMPDKATSESVLRSHTAVGLRRYVNDTFSSALEGYNRLGELINSMEGKITSGRTEKTHGHALSNLHQFVLSHDLSSGPKNKPGRGSDPGTLLYQMKELLPQAGNPEYCINILVDPHDLNQDRLKRYLFLWLNTVNLRVAEKHEYRDYERYVNLCDGLFERINAVYDDPIKAALESTVRDSKIDFAGFKLSP